MAKQTITCESCGKQYDYLKSESLSPLRRIQLCKAQPHPHLLCR